MRDSLKRTTRLYYGFQFFFPLFLWLPIFYEYQKRMGLDDRQIFGIQSFYYLAFFLLEIPTGFFADSWGYRRSMRLGAATLVIATALPIFWTSYHGFLTHFVLIALARSFVSGASSAYLYECMKAGGAEAGYKQVEGNARAYGLVGKVVCWAGVGAIMKWHITLPYWLTLVCAVISLAYARSLPEQRDPPKKTWNRGSGIWDGNGGDENVFWVSRVWTELRGYMLPVFRTLMNSPLLALLMIQGIGIFILGRIGQINLYQPILEEKKFDLVSYGWIMSVMTVFEALGSARHKWTKLVMSDINMVFALTLAIAGSLSLMAVSAKAGTFAGLMIFSYASGLAYPIQKQLLNDNISDSRYRATLLSMESLIDRGLCACVVPFIAPFVAGGKLDLFLHLSALATTVCVAILFIIIRRYNGSPVRA
jgi:MFS family permease